MKRIHLTAAIAIATLSSTAFSQLTWDPSNTGGTGGPVGGTGTWESTAGNWWDGANGTTWDNTGATTALFPDAGGNQVVSLGSGLTVGDVTNVANILQFRGAVDNEILTIKSGGATWDTGGGEIEFAGHLTLDVLLTMGSDDTLTINGGGTFDGGERPNNANWSVANSILDVTEATTVRANTATIGQFGTVKLAGGSIVVQERNADQVLVASGNTWELAGDVTFGNRFNRKSYLSGVVSGAGRIIYKDGASQNVGFMRIDNAANTFSGGLTVDAENNATMVFLNSVSDGVLGAVPDSFDADNIILKNGGTFRSNQTLTLDANRGITLENGGILNVSNSKTFTIGGAIAGEGGLQIGYTSGHGGVLALAGANATYTGETQIFEGNVRIEATNAMGQGVLNLGGTEGSARLILFGQNQTFGGIYNTGSKTKQIVNINSATTGSTRGTLTIDVAEGETYSAGSATGVNAADDRGNFNLIKDGLGSQTLANLQIGGDATVNAGTLQIGANNGISAVTGAATVTGGMLFGAENITGITSIDVTGGGSYRCSSDGGLGTVPGAPIADFITLDEGILDANLNAAYGGNFEIDSNRGITLGAGGGTIWGTTPSGAYIVTYNGIITGAGTLVKDKAQALQLGGANTYTGATTVTGGRLILAGSLVSDVTVKDGASFAGGDQATGTGSGTLPSLTLEDGSSLACFIDTAGVDAGKAVVSGAVSIGATTSLTVIDQGGDAVVAEGSELVLVDYTGGSLTGTFVDLSEGATVAVGTNNFTLSYIGGSGEMVTLTAQAAAAGYTTWASDNGLTEGVNDSGTDDPEFDGIENVLEYIFGGDPLVADLSILPTDAINGANYELSFTRSVDSKTDATVSVQFGSDLTAFPATTEIVPEASGIVGSVTFTITQDIDGNDDVTASIPHGGATEFFGRVSGESNP